MGTGSRVTILDLGVGNVGSIASMLGYLGVDHRIATSSGEEGSPTHLVLPGVGSFDAAGARLRREGWDEYVLKHLEKDRAVLGICLGMQLLAHSSDEGASSGLGVLPADVRSVARLGSGLRVPHMGWNRVDPGPSCPESDVLAPESRFYFAHSYYLDPTDETAVMAYCVYGSAFPAIMRRRAATGVQFHPEKSHSHGLRIFDRWTRGELW